MNQSESFLSAERERALISRKRTTYSESLSITSSYSCIYSSECYEALNLSLDLLSLSLPLPRPRDLDIGAFDFVFVFDALDLLV